MHSLEVNLAQLGVEPKYSKFDLSTDYSHFIVFSNVFEEHHGGTMLIAKNAGLPSANPQLTK